MSLASLIFVSLPVLPFPRARLVLFFFLVVVVTLTPAVFHRGGVDRLAPLPHAPTVTLLRQLEVDGGEAQRRGSRLHDVVVRSALHLLGFPQHDGEASKGIVRADLLGHHRARGRRGAHRERRGGFGLHAPSPEFLSFGPGDLPLGLGAEGERRGSDDAFLDEGHRHELVQLGSAAWGATGAPHDPLELRVEPYAVSPGGEPWGSLGVTRKHRALDQRSSKLKLAPVALHPQVLLRSHHLATHRVDGLLVTRSVLAAGALDLGHLKNVRRRLRHVRPAVCVSIVLVALCARRGGPRCAHGGRRRGERAVPRGPIVDGLLVVLDVLLRPIAVLELELSGGEALLAGQTAPFAARLAHDRPFREVPVRGRPPRGPSRPGLLRRRRLIGRRRLCRTRGSEDQFHEAALRPSQR